MALVPAITFQVSLDMFTTEVIGPLTSPRTYANISPDSFQTNSDTAVSEQNNRKYTRSTFFPGNLAGENRVLKHGDTFTEYGQKAIYIRDRYAVGYALPHESYLTIVS